MSAAQSSQLTAAGAQRNRISNVSLHSGGVPCIAVFFCLRYDCDMNRTQLIEEVRNYRPFNEQEERDRRIILEKLETVPDLFLRTNLTEHMTASAWVVNHDRTKLLMAYHKIYDSWSWLGGHADGEEDLRRVALTEVSEESGIRNVTLLRPDILSLEILTVDGHEKKGQYVPSHLHLNITYLIEADDREATHIREGENTGVAWFGIEEAVAASSEPWFRERIYAKLNAKLRAERIIY